VKERPVRASQADHEEMPGRPAPRALCAGADPDRVTPLAELLPPGRSRFIAATPGFVAVPTYGCFVPGYLLIVPRRHVLSFGRLDQAALAEAQTLIDELAARLQAVYGLPVLGFEYGISTTGVRRIEHAHWHLLPSAADLTGWLADRLTGQSICSLTGVPSGHSYIAVRSQDAALRVFDVAGPMEAHQRIRLRRTVAALDPRVPDDAWDWAEWRRVDLIRATVADLGNSTGAERAVGR
jgi:diadenosine tetraphosphate (Ap4A) HIT family hydrolase